MRLDKFLKVSRIIKRRPVAKNICKQNRVLVNNKIKKPGTDIESNDNIKIIFGNRVLIIHVDQTLQHPTKSDASRMFTVLSDEPRKKK